jgi:hypothetical protein
MREHTNPPKLILGVLPEGALCAGLSNRSDFNCTPGQSFCEEPILYASLRIDCFRLRRYGLPRFSRVDRGRQLLRISKCLSRDHWGKTAGTPKVKE